MSDARVTLNVLRVVFNKKDCYRSNALWLKSMDKYITQLEILEAKRGNN